MRLASEMLAILLLLWLICLPSASASGYIHVHEVIMHLDEENASFDLKYSLDTFTRLYVMILGCRSLEAELLSFLGFYKHIELMSADISGATLYVSGAGKYNSGYYLFDATPFGDIDEPIVNGIYQFSVVYPGGRIRTFYNVTATQNVFSEADKAMS
jgi:hypothetical protein